MHYFEGEFNWQGEIHKLRTRIHCPNESAAFSIFTRVLSQKLGRRASAIRKYFNGEKDNYKITKKEVENV